MTIEEHDNLLQELLKDDLSTERQLEIIGQLRTDKSDMTSKYNSLVNSSEKLQNDYNSLKERKVEDFFKVGTNGNTTSQEDLPNENIDPYKDVKSIDEIANDLSKGVM